MIVIVRECCAAFPGKWEATFDLAFASALAVAFRGAAERGALCAPSCRCPERSEGGTSWGEPNQLRRRASVASRGPSAPLARVDCLGGEAHPPERMRAANPRKRAGEAGAQSPSVSEWFVRVCRSQSGGRQAPAARGTGAASGGTVARGCCDSSTHGRPTGRPSWLSKLGPCGTRSVNVRGHEIFGRDYRGAYR